ncbi:MAG: T9SS type A sorting domain-containing protein, partial [Bacteroidetes bacterium]|nr:T9SS type A sorting domain-containing protein [Bacteroidota bacterium]
LPSKPTMGSDPDYGHVSENHGILVDQVLKGDQTLWWVFNDKGNVHTESQGVPIGLEIRAQAFAFATNDEINNMTFYSYEIINRSTYRLTETYFSQWIDTDLGFSNDDYVGCDVKRGLGYCYNGKDVDGSGQTQAYGAQPPAIGADFFQGPYMDPDGYDNPSFDGNGLRGPSFHGSCDIVTNDGVAIPMIYGDSMSGNFLVNSAAINGVNFGNGIIDDERFGMRRFVYHNNSGQGAPEYSTDPEIAIDYYNFLKGIWKDGTKMLYGGNAHTGAGAYGPECDFMFPGDSDPCNWGTKGQATGATEPWTEQTAGNQPDDRRFMQSAGPFTLEAGAVNYITVGIPWARATQGGPWASVELLRVVDDKCQRLFDNCFKVVDGPDAPDLTIQELNKEIIIYISNKSNNNKNESYQEWDPSIISPDNLSGSNRYDSLYRFEGYQIFQLKDATVSIAEIHDPDKARIVAQCDVKNFDKQNNPIGTLVNYNFDEAVGGNVPVEEVVGANKGVVHSFRFLNDEFATGDKRLINHKQYYYVAVAYAYNNYMKYSQDANTQIPGVSNLNGQKKVYLAGRKNIKTYTAIPHDPSPEANGTVKNSEYGIGPKITRVEGQGNGGMILELTQATINEILANGKSLHPVYENSHGPIDVKVVDPLNVESGEFTLKFNVDTVSTIDSSSWTLINNTTGDVYHSENTIKIANEQIFLDENLLIELGLSITIQQVYKPGDITNAVDNGFIQSSITYADSSKMWLTGVADQDGGGYWNWIRSGTSKDDIYPDNSDYNPPPATPVEGVQYWLDPQKKLGKMIESMWAPYRLCAKAGVVGPDAGDRGNGVAWDNALSMNSNKFENLASIDLVLTPDKSKWTRCVVLETTDEINTTLTEGNVKKFDLRAHQSVDKLGDPDGSGTTGMGWFPGYAINVETGERLNIMFGESSWLIGENGRDMIFNPTQNYTTASLNEILWGGKHFVYVMGHNGDMATDCPAYDEGQWIHNQLAFPNDLNHSTSKRNVFKDAMYAGIPMFSGKSEWLSNEVKIKIRMSKPYKTNYSTYGATTPQNNNYPLYTFSTGDIMTVTDNVETAKTALDLINVVPNPYYGYCGYEKNQIDNRIKITNLPEKCTVSIYTVNGILVRQFLKDEEKTSIDWDLKNFAGIPISGGIYIIHVNVEGVGEKTIKWFGTLRPIDLNSF